MKYCKGEEEKNKISLRCRPRVQRKKKGPSATFGKKPIVVSELPSCVELNYDSKPPNSPSV